MNATETTLEQALDAARRGDWEAANTLAGGYGIESVERSDRTLQYVNLGDTYAATVCQEADSEPYIGTWGDWIEAVEAEHCTEEGALVCGYCSEFTPKNRRDWSDVICQHCLHNVADGTPAPKCECADRECACGGNCNHQSVTTLFRVDMDDSTGTAFCDRCASDAMDCGLFSGDDDSDVA